MSLAAAEVPVQGNSNSGDAQMKQKDPPEDTYARDSFTFRRMTRGQLWSISIVVGIIVIASIAYLY